MRHSYICTCEGGKGMGNNAMRRPVTVASRTMGILNDDGGIASECGCDGTGDDDADRDTR